MTHPTLKLLQTLRPRVVRPDAPASVPLVEGHLHIALTVDEGQGPRDLTEAEILAWNTTIRALLPIALDHLREDSRARDWLSVETVPGMSLYQALDGQSSARALVLDALVGDWPMAGVAVAMPSQDQLIVVPLNGVEDLDALNVMVTATEMAFENSEAPLSNQAFWLDGTAWHHIDVRHQGDEAIVVLPSGARRAIEQLAAMGLVAVAGEA